LARGGQRRRGAGVLSPDKTLFGFIFVGKGKEWEEQVGADQDEELLPGPEIKRKGREEDHAEGMVLSLSRQREEHASLVLCEGKEKGRLCLRSKRYGPMRGKGDGPPGRERKRGNGPERERGKPGRG
jgi:hypothetical protein